ncbi:MAG: sensor histidine kinase, partial [Phycisphaerae bacterium]
TTAGYVCIVAALALVVLVTLWGAWRDITDVKRALLANELGRLRSHATRTVGRIENYLEDRPSERDIASVAQAEWLRDFWRRVVPRERQRMYAALVADDATVIMHSDPSQQDKTLGKRWFERTFPDGGDDVVITRSKILAGGQLAYDIRIPVEVDGIEIAAYHSGFDVAWLDEEVAARQQTLYGRWLLLGGLIAAIVLGAGLSLFHLARRTAALQQALGMARTQQLAELGRLAGALAHEVRNPLNALRLNLHAVSRFAKGEAKMPHEEMANVLQESNEEIERLEGLVRSILGYARPDQARDEDIDLTRELDATLDFIRQLVERDNITIRAQLPDRPVLVRMDRDRFRQMVLNLLNNARDATGRDGRISVGLAEQEGWADLSIADSGPGVPADQQDRIFEPFFTTKDRGCGLGLTLVKRFAEEAGGVVTCESNGDRGARFRVCLPAAARARVAHAESTS